MVAICTLFSNIPLNTIIHFLNLTICKSEYLITLIYYGNIILLNINQKELELY